ncbi:MAG TPA: Hsp20/alpha crystallin family protein [Longimicrobiales bacterium]|nr:Hsp20/alpha crystallin family protein [Longimicrobiales bacterium]
MSARDKSKEQSWSQTPSGRDRTTDQSVPVSGTRASGSTPRQRVTSPSTLARARESTSPFGIMHRLSDEMSQFFNRFGLSRDVGFGLEPSFWAPQVDVLRKGDDLVVRADLPGLSKDDISVDVTDNVLTIRGERREESKEEGEGYYWHERSSGSFARSIPLPESADPERANARFENGVLEVRLPAPEREETRGRRIDVK